MFCTYDMQNSQMSRLNSHSLEDWWAQPPLKWQVGVALRSSGIYAVSQKHVTTVYTINNFNNKCPITIIFGTASSQSMRHRKTVSVPTSHLSSATALPCDIAKHNKKTQLTLANPCDAKGFKNCSNSTCFVSFHRIPFPQISNYQCIASRGMFRL